MTTPPRPLSPYDEGRLPLASHALQEKRIASERRTPRLYSVPHETLQRRLQGIQPKHETTSASRNLRLVEE